MSIEKGYRNVHSRQSLGVGADQNTDPPLVSVAAMSQDELITIGPLIVASRRRQRCSQRELAAEVCRLAGRPTVTRCEISRYEREVRIPTAERLSTLAQALGVPEAQLMRASALARARRAVHRRAETQSVSSRLAVMTPDLLMLRLYVELVA